MDVASTDQFVIHPSVICRELSGETVLLNLESGVYYGLDAVGTRVWQLLMQGCTIASVRDTMIEEYDVAPDVLNADVMRLVGELRDRDVIVAAHGGADRKAQAVGFRLETFRQLLGISIPKEKPICELAQSIFETFVGN